MGSGDLFVRRTSSHSRIISIPHYPNQLWAQRTKF